MRAVATVTVPDLPPSAPPTAGLGGVTFPAFLDAGARTRSATHAAVDPTAVIATLRYLLTVAVADSQPRIREAVLTCLAPRTDPYLAHVNWCRSSAHACAIRTCKCAPLL